MGKGILTTRGIIAMKPGEWAADPAARGAGRLQVRKLAGGGTAYYYRYTTPSGARDRLPLGTGASLADARKMSSELSKRYQAGERDLRAILDSEQRESERIRETAKREAEAATSHAEATLGVLLTAYVAQLRRDGKDSARAVETAAERHVRRPWPKLWMTPATDVLPDDLLAVIARVVDDGKLREAAKLRSYLRAAYAAAIRSRQDARSLATLRDLRISTNPARDLATVDGAIRTGERALSLAELRAYWRRIRTLPAPSGPLLAFHLLTGGQRIKQLAQVSLDDLDEDLQTVRLRDPKGRRKMPRLHYVPVIKAAAGALKEMTPTRLGPFLWTVTAGESGADYTSARNRLRAVVEVMLEAGELPGGAFTLGDIRRTVETRLAAAGVAEHVRAQLQSHGLGGVQVRHYDRHTYLEEKRTALKTLWLVLTSDAAKVTPIRKRAEHR